MTHHTHPQVGEQVQITIGLDKGKRYTVIGAYSDQVELGDENGKFIRSASAVICNVCPPPAANTDGESLAARAAGGQGVGTSAYAPSLVLLPVQYCNPYQRWQQVCDKARNSTFLPRVVQARALIDWAYLE